MRFLLSVALLGFFIAPAWADTKISNLPVEPSIGGAELTVCVDGGVTRSCSLSAIKTFVGATGIGLPNDITESPYNATCNGVADDSDAFESAVDDGGVFYIPPGSRCILKSTANHTWSKDTTFYGLAGAERDTHIDIDGADNFLLSGGDVTLRNLTFKNGDDFINANALAATVGRVECINTIWDNVHTACVRFSTTAENAAAKFERVVFKDSVIENAPTASEGFWMRGGELVDVLVTNNWITGGENAIRVGFVANADTFPDEVSQRRQITITDNHIRAIDGNNTTGGTTVGCIVVHGDHILIDGNQCDNVLDSGADQDDIECIYTKARFAIISNNHLNDCGEDQGGIVLKGMATDADTCAAGACGQRSIVSNNVVRYTLTDNGNYQCVYIQATDALVIGNVLIGCTNNGVKIASSGDFNNIIIKDNSFYDLRGGAAVNVDGDQDNVVIEGNTVWEYVDADVATLDVFNVVIVSGETANYIRIAGNRILTPDITEGDNITGVLINNGGTINDLEIKDNFFHSDMDIGIEIIGSGTINRLSIYMNELNGVANPYFEAAAQTITTGGCLVFGNRNWTEAEGDDCDGSSGGDT